MRNDQNVPEKQKYYFFITFLIIDKIKNFVKSDRFRINTEIENSLTSLVIKIRSCCQR